MIRFTSIRHRVSADPAKRIPRFTGNRGIVIFGNGLFPFSLFFQRIKNLHQKTGIEVGGCREVEAEPDESDLNKCIKMQNLI